MSAKVPAADGKVKDPLGHLKIAVKNYALSAVFYNELFERIGLKKVSDKETGSGWVTSEGFGIWVAQAEVSDYTYVFSAPGLHHLCLKASSPEQVDIVYDFLQQKEVHIFNPPRRYPEYTEHYYAVFFADPDGMKLEFAYY